MLIIFSGLPGVGKSTVARALAFKIKATFLRIDSLEHALVESKLVEEANEIGPAGYMAAYALAADNLRLGMPVVADSVNPLTITRDAWRETALKNDSNYLEIEVKCSNPVEHRKRVELRQADIPGFILPTWTDVLKREYQAWNRDHLVLDTFELSVDQALNLILEKLNDLSSAPSD